jgi:hypothetical protein
MVLVCFCFGAILYRC